MRRAVLIALGVVLSGIAAALVYVALTREGTYQRLVTEGERALAADQTFAAVHAFSGAIVLKPGSMLPYLRRGETYRRRGELLAALQDLRKAAEIDPTAPRPLEEIGDVNLALERYARAAESFEAYLKLDERSPTVLYKLALARFRQGNAGGAVNALRQAIALNDRLAEPFYLLGLCQAQLGQPADAVDSLGRALGLSPASLAFREELVRLLLELRRDDDAIAQLEALAALEKGRADYLIQAGLIYGRLGRTDLAVAELNRAAERDPQPRVYQALGRVWLQAAESRRDSVALSKAIEALDRGVRGPGATSEGLTLYGRALLQLGDLVGAEQAFEQAIDKSPVDPIAYREIGSLAQRRGDLQVANDALVRYMALATDPAETRDLPERIGNVALQLGHMEDAVRWFRQASEGAADDVEALVRLARVQLRAADPEGAAATIERGLKKTPTDPALLALQHQVSQPVKQ